MDKARVLDQYDAIIRDEFHRGECTRTHGPRGGERLSVEAWRRNGQTVTWKTRPDEFRVPIKYGMRGYDSITPDNMGEFHLAWHCPLDDVEYRNVRDDGHVIEISKAGGGTLGRRYDGYWDVVIYDRRGGIAMDDKITTGTPKTHAEMEEIAFDFLEGN